MHFQRKRNPVSVRTCDKGRGGGSIISVNEEFFKHPEIRHEIFGQSLPTSTTVEVRRLSHPDLMVEVEAIAVIDQ
jgi:hypothetical protein